MARNRMEVTREEEKEPHEKKKGTIYMEMAASICFKYLV